MILLALILAGMAGVACHWYNRWYQGRTKTNFWSYLFKENISSTVYSFGAIIGTEITFYESLDPATVLLSAAFLKILWSQLTSAYLIDSVLNRGKVEDHQYSDDAKFKKRLEQIKESNSNVDDLNKFLEEEQ